MGSSSPFCAFQGGVQQKVLEHVSSEGKKALAHFMKRHPALPGMTLKAGHSLNLLDKLLSARPVPETGD